MSIINYIYTQYTNENIEKSNLFTFSLLTAL